MAATAATAVFVFLTTNAEGSYFATAWPVAGAVLVVSAAALAMLGGRLGRLTLAAAAAFLAYGLVCVLSVAWGGLPDVAWTWLDQMAIAAAALAVGALAAHAGGRLGRRVILAGVLGGTSAEAIYLLARLAHGGVPASWFEGREVSGPVQYHNAQAACFAIGIPLALWLSTSRRLPARAAAGAATVVLGGALLVTQSRGALLALLLGVVVQVAVAPSRRLAGHAVLGAVAVGLLVLPLRTVDASLVDHVGGDTSAFRTYAVWTALSAIVLAAVYAVPQTRRTDLAVVALAGATILVGVAVAAPHVGRVGPAIHRALNGEKTADLPAGQTRLSSLSLSGRRQIWRAALDAYDGKPVLGIGTGSFTGYFTRVRTNKDLYVLQPHSIELEALSELGLPGALVLLCAFAALVAAVARGHASRPVKAAAAGVLVGLVAQASIDWTFSFPAIVAAAFLVAGVAASRTGGVRAPNRLGTLGLTLAVAVALVSFAGPYFSAHDVTVAARASTSSDRAWTLLRHAKAFDPWNPDVPAAQGQLAENAHEYALAVRLYAHAATLSRSAWAEEYARARALRSGGHVAEALAACARAQHLNPLEPLLEHGPCASPSG